MSSRKDFLLAGALAAAMPAIADADPAPAKAAAPPPEPPWPKFAFDLVAFNAMLDGTQPHKHLFTSVNIDKGTIFAMVRNTLEAYGDLDVPASDVLPAAVLYHGTGVTLGFDDAMWDKYIIPVSKKLAGVPEAKGIAAQFDAVVKPGKTGNPCLHGDDGASIETLVRKGGLRLFLCNEATRGFSSAIAHHLGLNALDVYHDIAAHLVPNAMLTPTGVWAVHAVQEHGFTLLPVTVTAA